MCPLIHDHLLVLSVCLAASCSLVCLLPDVCFMGGCFEFITWQQLPTLRKEHISAANDKYPALQTFIFVEHCE